MSSAFVPLASILVSLFSSLALASPVAPISLIATPTSATEITLTWVDNSSDESSFIVERSFNNKNYVQVGTTPANTTTYTDRGLREGQLYLYRVRATGSTGHSSFSNWNYAVTQTSVNSSRAPTALNATWEPGGGAKLWWKENFANEIGFEIECSINGGAFLLVGTTPPNVTTWTDSQATPPDTTFTYRVRARSASAASGYSKTANWHLYLQDLTGEPEAYFPRVLKYSDTIAAPTNLVATPVHTSRIDLEWQDNSENEDQFIVLYSTNNYHFLVLTTTSPDVTRFSHTNVIPETTYYYRVVAANSTPLHSALVPTAQTSMRARPFNEGLAAPSQLVVTRESTGNLLTWQINSSNEAGFAIERAMGTHRFTRIGTVASGVNSFLDSEGNTFVRYRVQALHESGDSAYSPATTAVWLNESSSDIVQSLVATALSPHQINLSWQGAQTYWNIQIERSLDGTAFEPLSIARGNNGFQDRKLAPNTTYYYRVKAVNQEGSPYTSVVSATTQALSAAPSVPLLQSATGVSRSQINLKWSLASVVADTVIVELSVDGGANFSTLATVDTDTLTFNHTGLSEGANYSYRIKAINGFGPSAYSGVLTASVLTADPSVTATVTTFEQHRRLNIHGTAANDVIVVSQSGDNIQVAANGGTPQVYVGPFGELAVRGGDGSDDITVESSVSLPQVLVFGGTGADNLKAFGSGKQTIVAVGGGRDQCTGNGVNTSYWADQNGMDVVNASAAEVRAYRVHRVNQFHQPFSFDPVNSKYVSKELEGQSWPESGIYNNYSNYKRYPNNSLWGRAPNFLDVNQAFWQNCGFLAPTQAYADKYPDRLQETAVDLGDGTFAVRVGSLTGQTFLRVDGDFLPGYGSYVGRSGNLWLLVLEKAFTSYGLMPNYIEPGFSDRHTEFHNHPEVVYANLKSIFDAGKYVVTGTAIERNLDVPGVYFGHAYSLEQVFRGADGQPYFVIKNPYGILGFHGNPDPQQGLMTLSLKELQYNYGAGQAQGYDAAPTNRVPTAHNQSVSTIENSSVAIVLGGFDEDGESLNFRIISPPSRGTLAGSGANRTYTPNTSFTGSDSFTFVSNDGKADSNIATVSITVAPAIKPIVRIKAAAHSSEPSTRGRFTLSLTNGPFSAPVIVNYSLTGSASKVDDYVEPSGSAEIPAGSSTTTIYIAPIDDDNAEGLETVMATILPAPQYQVYSTGKASIYIYDDEKPTITLSVTDSAMREPADKGQIKVVATPAPRAPLRVNYSLTGVAVSGDDFIAPLGYVVIPAGSTTQLVDIVPLEDDLVEVDETVTLKITAGDEYSGTPSKTLTLKDR